MKRSTAAGSGGGGGVPKPEITPTPSSASIVATRKIGALGDEERRELPHVAVPCSADRSLGASLGVRRVAVVEDDHPVATHVALDVQHVAQHLAELVQAVDERDVNALGLEDARRVLREELVGGRLEELLTPLERRHVRHALRIDAELHVCLRKPERLAVADADLEVVRRPLPAREGAIDIRLLEPARGQMSSQRPRDPRELLQLSHPPGSRELLALSLAHESAKRVGASSAPSDPLTS